MLHQLWVLRSRKHQEPGKIGLFSHASQLVAHVIISFEIATRSEGQSEQVANTQRGASLRAPAGDGVPWDTVFMESFNARAVVEGFKCSEGLGSVPEETSPQPKPDEVKAVLPIPMFSLTSASNEYQVTRVVNDDSQPAKFLIVLNPSCTVTVDCGGFFAEHALCIPLCMLASLAS